MTRGPRPNRRERRRGGTPQGRRSPQSAAAPRASWRDSLSLTAVGIVIVAVAVVALIAWAIIDRASGGSTNPADDDRATLPGAFYADQGRDHLPAGEQYSRYSSNPPTSGPHAPSSADWRVHQEPVPKEQLVHNLEHGGVAILYNCPQGCADITKDLAEFTQQQVRDGHFVLLAPYPGMEHKVALISWTRLDAFDSADMARVKRFVDAHLCRFDPENICR